MKAGGAIFENIGNFSANGALIENNHASNVAGGWALVDVPYHVTPFANLVFRLNTACQGGGIYLLGYSQLSCPTSFG